MGACRSFIFCHFSCYPTVFLLFNDNKDDNNNNDTEHTNM